MWTRDTCGPAFGMWESMSRSLWQHSARVALTWRGSDWTYADLLDGVARHASELRRLGVQAGDRVMLLHSNGPGYLIADLTLMALGAVKVPVSTMLSEAEVGIIAERVEPAAAVVSSDCRALAEQIRVPLAISENDRADPGLRFSANLTLSANRSLNDPAAIFFSGGTTGVPKGIVHSERNLVTNWWAQIIETGIAEDDRVGLMTPLVHASGLFCQVALLRGARIVLRDGFDANAFCTDIDRDEITWTFLVPTMIHRITDVAVGTGWRNTTLRTVQYGASPISPELLERALAVFGPVFQQLYAQTESPNYATALSKADHIRAQDYPELLGSAGRATAMVDVAIMDEDGRRLPADEIGEVVFNSPYAMTGYWRDLEGYQARFHGHWLRTGDIGFLNSEGYLYLVDRKNDMIVSGGLNVFSIEVEDVLTSLPAVAEAAVVARPQAEWGESVHAFVVLSEKGHSASTEDILRDCRHRLATYKRPKTIEIIEALPLTRFGKVDKKQLRRALWEGRSRSIG